MKRARLPPFVGAFLAIVSLFAVLSQRAEVELRETRLIFGTLVEMVIRHDDAAAAQTAMTEAGRLMQRLHHNWHAWEPGMLSTLNAQLRAGQRAQISPALADVLRQAQHLACTSGGTFEPAIGQLIGLWGFHTDMPTGTVPTAQDIATLRRQAPQMADLVIDNTSVTTKNRAVQLDLGAFGKGAALDAARTVLRAHGIENAVLNAGGDVNVIGNHGSRSWRVAIRDPFQWGAVASVEMQPGEALYTSGNYERFFEEGGVRFAHILDPRTGAPVQKIVSVSVLHRSGAVADAAATALSVAGPENWAQVAADMSITRAMLITDAGRVLASPDMAARLRFENPHFERALEVQPLPEPRELGCGPDTPVRLSAL